MSTLKFAEVHNLVAFLSKPTESEGFEQIVKPYTKPPLIEEVFTVKPKIKILMDKFEPPPDSPPDNQFDGRIRSDHHRNVDNFLKISNLFQYGGNQEEVIMLITFPFTISGEAKTWLNELNEETITSWNK
nr:reverse transcriptase domain-containing protein [Tanacetum cinerariifolium]